jgi:antagonist of KipI
MASPLFSVNKTGILTSFQDLGRIGFQKYGIVQSGAMDQYALQVANLLVGNQRDEAGIEVTMLGPTLHVLSDAIMSICGGNLSPLHNNKPAPMWKSFLVKKGDTLSFGQPKQGVRSYIAVAGGYDVPLVMNSKSYYKKANIGEEIIRNNVIYRRGSTFTKIKSGIGVHADMIPNYKQEITVRVIAGPHDEHFSPESIQQFYTQPYILKKGDRMGVFLEGEKPLIHNDHADILSDAIPFGAIQVTSNGQPIILMADRQTTGGYTRIGTIITGDIMKLAQLLPGGTIHFKQVTVEEAQEVFIVRERKLKQLQLFLQHLSVPN